MPKLNALTARRMVTPGRHGDGGGLYLQVRDAERRSWLFRFMIAGRAREMGLGPFPDVSLAEARDAAAEARRQLRAGVDPLAARDAARQATKAARAAELTFAQVVDRYLAAHQAGWRNEKHRTQWRTTLDTYAAPVMGALPVAAVETGHVMQVLEPIWTTKPETASRLRGRVEAVLDYATARGWRSGDNPARWRGHVANLLPRRSKVRAVEHHAALPWAEVGAFLARLREMHSMSARCLEFVILTAVRSGEALGARWGEMDLKAGVWTIPRERMKAGVEHRVPLVGPALALLQAQHELLGGEGYVFPGGKAGRPLSVMAMTMVLRGMKRTDITVHGFRSAFRDWAAEATTYPREVAEAALAHTLRDKVEAAYRRGDLFEKRRAMMLEWGEWCSVRN